MSWSKSWGRFVCIQYLMGGPQQPSYYVPSLSVLHTHLTVIHRLEHRAIPGYPPMDDKFVCPRVVTQNTIVYLFKYDILGLPGQFSVCPRVVLMVIYVCPGVVRLP